MKILLLSILLITVAGYSQDTLLYYKDKAARLETEVRMYQLRIITLTTKEVDYKKKQLLDAYTIANTNTLYLRQQRKLRRRVIFTGVAAVAGIIVGLLISK